MKVLMRKRFYISIATALLVSCASVPKNETTSENAKAEPSYKEATAAELYEESIKDLKFTLVSSPKETTKGKIFTSPYIIKVEDEDSLPVASFEISVIYPSSRENGSVVFAQTMISTDIDGRASFLPPVPEYSFNSEISFFPKGDMSDSEIEKIASEHTIKAPFKVQTNKKSSGGIIALVDFNQNGKAVTSNPVSSSNMLMTLMKLGFTQIGNAPQEVSNAVIQNDEAKIFARAKSIAPSFIIFGTVKIDSLEKNESGSTYTLTADIKSMDSKSGKITFKTQKTVSVTDKNDWNALDKARKAIAEQIANEIKYGI